MEFQRNRSELSHSVASGLRVRAAPCGLGLLVLIAGCGSVPEGRLARQREFSQFLVTCDRANTTLATIERRLDLGRPIDVRWPSLTDPMWWFSYIARGCRVEVGANAENMRIGQSTADRSGFFYTGYFWVGPAHGEIRRRIDAAGRASRTHQLDPLDLRPNPFADYLHKLDMTGQVTLAEIERDLGLGRPYLVERPAFVEPMWWFYYKQGRYVVALGGNTEQEVAAGAEADHRDLFIFTGYWGSGEGKE